MEFTQFIHKKFEEWERENHGGRKGFAAYLGVPQTSLSNWMNSGYSPGKGSISQLVDVLGEDVYDVLDLRRPGLGDLPLILPPAFRTLLQAATRELADALAENKINPASPEGEALADSIMEKHGFKRISTTTPGKSG